MKELWTSLAAIMGALAFFQGVLHAVFPAELRFAAGKFLRRLASCFSTYCYFDITEIDGVNTNELYNAVQLYLSSSASVSGTRLSLTRALNSSAFTFGLSNNDRLVDAFAGAAAVWEHVVAARQSTGFTWRPVPDEKRGFTLRLRKRDKRLLIPAYLDHIMERAADLRRRHQDRLLYTNSRGGCGDARGNPWESVPFKHPSTFDTLAMDPDKKADILADLSDFAGGAAFYQQTGRAWKRGYLLYGPPGTGKSSMIAAMANYLRYDIYDLELTEVHSNSELRKLLMKTTPKSIIVIEDIDCSITLSNRRRKGPPPPLHVPADPPEFRTSAEEDAGSKTITLSGLLNFTDGLWSCCGSERIFVFTTNHVERLDPALLRSGRMDMHVCLSYCSFAALKILMKNYLGWEEGDQCGDDDDDDDEVQLMRELEEAIGEAEMTPADISEVLIKNRRRGKRDAIRELLGVLRSNLEPRKARRAAVTLADGRTLEVEEEHEKRALENPVKEAMEISETDGKKESGEG